MRLNYKIIAFGYSTPDLNEFSGNEFLELALGALKDDVDALLKKHPEKRKQILKEANEVQDKIFQLFHSRRNTLIEKEIGIETLGTGISSKSNKLENYRQEFQITDSELKETEVELKEVTSFTESIAQVKAKTSLLNKIENIINNYAANARTYLVNPYLTDMKELANDIKGLYRETKSLAINAPFLRQFSREALAELLQENSSGVTSDYLANILLNEDVNDFIWMAIIYIERFSIFGVGKEEVIDSSGKLFNDSDEAFIEMWELMKPINEWGSEIQYLTEHIYDSILNKDLIDNAINKATKKNQLNADDMQEINIALANRKQAELPLIFRLNIANFIKNLLLVLGKERVKEKKEITKLDRAIRAANRQGEDIPLDILSAATEGKKYSFEIIKDYYDVLIPRLTRYIEIVQSQAVSRFEEDIFSNQAAIESLLATCKEEQEALEEEQKSFETVKLHEKKLKEQLTGLKILISSLASEIAQAKLDISGLEQAISNNTEKYDNQLNLAERYISRMVGRINDTNSYEIEIDEDIDEPEEPQYGIEISSIKNYAELSENTIYSATNNKNIRTFFMFTGAVLKTVDIDLKERFLKSSKKGLVGAVAANGIKFMKENRKHSHEIKLIGADMRIYGSGTKVDGKDVILFNAYDSH